MMLSRTHLFATLQYTCLSCPCPQRSLLNIPDYFLLVCQLHYTLPVLSGNLATVTQFIWMGSVIHWGDVSEFTISRLKCDIWI